MSAEQTPGAPTEQEWAEALFAHTGETCGNPECGDGFGYHDLDSTEERRAGCRHLAAALRPLIDREREAAKAEEMAAVAGPVLALADEIDRHDFTPECTDGGHPCRECNTAEAIRAAIPADATEALARLKAEWQAEALREAAEDWEGGPTGEAHLPRWRLTDRADRLWYAREAQQDGGDRG